MSSSSEGARKLSQDLLNEAEYMEDLESPSSQTKTTDDATTASIITTATVVTAKEPPAKKRQLNLTDMFSVTPGTKRQRTTSTGSASSAAGTSIPSGPPRLINGLRHFNSIPFNVEAYRSSLSEEEKKLLTLECETMGPSWLKVLSEEIRKPYFLKLKRFLWDEGVQGATEQSMRSPKIFPPPKDIYNWSRVTPLGRLRVVIIGQDPYHGPGQAHGLCFSVRKGVVVPPSLKNMYKELKTDYPAFNAPKHGDLTGWAKNGVLLINTSLTVRSGNAGSHVGKGWEEFTDTVVQIIDKYGGASLSKAGGVGRGVVFIAWGSWAAKRVVKLSKTKHLILTSAHPSPLSASRGFFGNGHFRKANDWLEQKYGTEARVDWTKLD